jgi:hypothetical protein
MLSAQEALDEMKHKAQQGSHSDRMRRIIEAVDITAGAFRRRMIALRDREPVEGNDMWHIYNLLRFWVRVSPKTPAKVDELWKEFEPTWDHFFLQTALGNRARSKYFADVIRRMSFIFLAPGATDEHKKFLLEKLQLVKERLRTSVQQPEIDRAIQGLELYFDMKKKIKQQISSSSQNNNSNQQELLSKIPAPYTYGDSTMVKTAQRGMQLHHNNPLLGIKLGNEEAYLEMRQDEEKKRGSSSGESVPTEAGIPIPK